MTGMDASWILAGLAALALLPLGPIVDSQPPRRFWVVFWALELLFVSPLLGRLFLLAVLS